MGHALKNFVQHVRLTVFPFWRTYVIVLAPLLPISLLLNHYENTAARCAWGVIVMSIYWMTEAVPLVVTGMLPVFIFPALGLIDSDTVSKLYLTKSNMLRLSESLRVDCDEILLYVICVSFLYLIAGLMVAVAIENVNLHKRIALRIILLTGTSPRRIMLGFMLSAVLISMWISNTAACAMMVPIVQAVLEEIYGRKDVRATPVETLPILAFKNRAFPLLQSNLFKSNFTGPAKNSIMDALSQGNKHLCCWLTSRDTVLPEVADGLFSHHSEYRKEAMDIEEEIGHLRDSNSMQILNNMNYDGKSFSADAVKVTVRKEDSENNNNAEELKKRYHTAKIGNLLAICFASNLGGTGVATGTAPNLILIGILDAIADVMRLFRTPTNVPEDVRRRWEEEADAEVRARHVIRARYDSLGQIRFEEAMVLFLFIILVASWVFRSPQFVPGWAHWFQADVSEASTCVMIIFLMFIIPKNPSFPFFTGVKDKDNPPEASKGLLNWQIIHEKVPWNVVILMGNSKLIKITKSTSKYMALANVLICVGGAVGMAEVCKTSGLTTTVGEQFGRLDYLSPPVVLLIMTTVTAFLTELASNAATASIVLPILHSLSMQMGVNPLYFMLPATITTSYSFMLPVANPPNAITYTAAGNMKVSDMVSELTVAGLIIATYYNSKKQ
ncbi:unnamed protein product [Notodromas monacha]|uniref:Uncharacterized protein n=1 Tax=Notodromas monacha TaxID=399045 RepID=A0A7R9BP57_9CRUS|nr:unnamed protein product [Notodromas monacha]CAG0918016.1 unnamed protein product [Notodromas monacha]